MKCAFQKGKVNMSAMHNSQTLPGRTSKPYHSRGKGLLWILLNVNLWPLRDLVIFLYVKYHQDNGRHKNIPIHLQNMS